jgi:hypothetical protein
MIFWLGIVIAGVSGLVAIGFSREGVKQRFPKLSEFHLDIVALILLGSGLLMSVVDHYASESEVSSLRGQLKTNDDKLKALQSDTAPRSLDATTRTRLIAALAACDSQRSVSIATPFSDRETQDFAAQIASAFRDAGWEVEGPGRSFITTAPSYFIIEVDSVELAHPCAGLVQKAFRDVGFEVRGEIHPKAPSDKINLIIGTKPRQNSK